MTGSLVNALGSTPPLAEIFSNSGIVRAMLDVETALARVQAALGIIPGAAAEAIAACAADVDAVNADDLVRAAPAAATPVVPFVRMLTERVRASSPEAAGYVHWGVTSQDVADTAFNLCLTKAQASVAGDHSRLIAALDRLSDEHASTVMIGRTLLQPAAPITFGLKVAGWRAACDRSWLRLADAARDALVVQLGGATGTLASFDGRGLEVARRLAAELKLGDAGAPWHAHRDRLAAYVAASGVYVASLGKMARDVSLLMQFEVAEALEPGGRSSAMPQKRNPAASAIALAAATRMPGLVAACLAGMVQEHERAAGGWQAEWPTLAAVAQTTGAAAATMAGAIEGLRVDPDRMRANLDATGGLVLAERVTLHLARTLGRDAAHALVSRAAERSGAGSEPFADALMAIPEIAAVLSAAECATLLDPTGYLGEAETIRRRLLGRAKE